MCNWRRARASTKRSATLRVQLFFLNNINAQTQAFASQDSRGHEFDKHAIVRGQQSISTKLALAAARDVCERKIMRILKLYCAVCTFYESEDEFFNLRDKRRLYRISLTLSFSCKYFLKMRALLLYTSLKEWIINDAALLIPYWHRFDFKYLNIFVITTFILISVLIFIFSEKIKRCRKVQLNTCSANHNEFQL